MLPLYLHVNQKSDYDMIFIDSKFGEDPIKNKVSKAQTIFSPFVAMETESSDQLCPRINTDNPLPQWWYLCNMTMLGQLTLEMLLFESVGDGQQSLAIL